MQVFTLASPSRSRCLARGSQVVFCKKKFVFFILREREKNCLVTDAVSVLLDGLDEGLDDGGLSDLAHWGEGIRDGSGGSNGNWGWGGDGGSGVGKRGSGVSKRGSGKTGVAKGGSGKTGVTKRCSGKTGVTERCSGKTGVGENGCLGSNGQDSKNNLLWEKYIMMK